MNSFNQQNINEWYTGSANDAVSFVDSSQGRSFDSIEQGPSESFRSGQMQTERYPFQSMKPQMVAEEQINFSSPRIIPIEIINAEELSRRERAERGGAPFSNKSNLDDIHLGLGRMRIDQQIPSLQQCEEVEIIKQSRKNPPTETVPHALQGAPKPYNLKSKPEDVDADKRKKIVEVAEGVAVGSTLVIEVAHAAESVTMGTLHAAENVAIGTANIVKTAAVGTLHAAENVAIGTANAAESVTMGTVHVAENLAIGTAHVVKTAAVGTLHAAEDVAMGTVHLVENVVMGTVHAAENLAIGTAQVVGAVVIGTVHAAENVAIGTAHVVGNVANATANATIGTVHFVENAAVGTVHLAENATIGTAHLIGNAAVGTAHLAENVAIGSVHLAEDAAIGTAHAVVGTAHAVVGTAHVAASVVSGSINAAENAGKATIEIAESVGHRTADAYHDGKDYLERQFYDEPTFDPSVALQKLREQKLSNTDYVHDIKKVA